MNYISNKFFSDKKNISQYDIAEKVSLIESVLQDFYVVRDTLKNDEHIDTELKSFLYKRIEESILKAKIAKRATLFEAEKSGYDLLFS